MAMNAAQEEEEVMEIMGATIKDTAAVFGAVIQRTEALVSDLFLCCFSYLVAHVSWSIECAIAAVTPTNQRIRRPTTHIRTSFVRTTNDLRERTLLSAI